MECTVRWTSGMTFLAETASNHVVAMDGAPEGGGRNLAPRPMEMVLVGTGGCTASSVGVVRKKKGQGGRGREGQGHYPRAPAAPHGAPPRPPTLRWSRPGVRHTPLVRAAPPPS